MNQTMSRFFIVGVCAVWFLAMPVREMAAQTSPQGSTQNHREMTEVEGENTREVSPPSSEAPVPLISFIDSPGASCYQPNSAQNICYINWYYISVTADPNYMVYMNVLINDRLVARYHGFFQTSMFIPFNMNGGGFRVTCGSPGSGGNPEMGRAYSWTIRAEDTATLKAANYGTVYCPAFRGAIK
jgi:hypothetical protein